MHALLLAFAVVMLWIFGCSSAERTPREPTIRELCAPGADLARKVAHTIALGECADDKCRRAVDLGFNLADLAAQSYCPHVPKPVEVWPADAGAGGGPTARVGSCEDCRRAGP